MYIFVCLPALRHEGVEQLWEDVLLGDEIVGEGGDGEELDGERGHAERVLVVVVDEVAHHGAVTLQNEIVFLFTHLALIIH